LQYNIRRSEMNQYIGTKVVNAIPMTRAAYNEFRGWQLPENESGEDTGYLVEYTESNNKPNTPEYEGYVSWSPADVFEQSYYPVSNLTFGFALEALKVGHKVARVGWNGAGMFLLLVKGSRFQVSRPPLLGIYPEGTTINYMSHIDIRTSGGQIVPWVASQADLLENDWFLVSD